MKTAKKDLLRLLCLLFAAAVLSLSALAVPANVTYTGNAGKFVFAPGSEYSLTDLFPNFKDVMPGDTLTQKITVNNDANDRVKVRIYMRSLGPTDESYVAFLNQLRLTVEKAEETPMFDAAADKTDGLTEWTCIGTLYSGGKVDLNVTLDVPVTLDNMFSNEYGEIEWEFMVEELPVSPDDPKPPKTGDNTHARFWIGLFGISAVVLILTSGKKDDDAAKKRVEH